MKDWGLAVEFVSQAMRSVAPKTHFFVPCSQDLKKHQMTQYWCDIANDQGKKDG